MALNLLDSFGKRGVSYQLLTRQADVTDTSYLSKYFVISEFNPKFTAGRNAFALNGSSFLKTGSEIIVECIDSAGNNLYIEMAKVTDESARIYAYKEATSFILSIHVYNDTSDGIGKLICFGTLIDGRTVKWQQNITIDKTLQNSSKVRFYARPTIEIDSILVPVISSNVTSTLKETVAFGGGGYGISVDPPKDTILPSINRRNINVDYRLVCTDPVIPLNPVDDKNAFNSQMIGSTVTLYINTIQVPYSNTYIIPTVRTASFIISEIVDNKTAKLKDPYYYNDTKNNIILTNINDTDFSIVYPYISYNNETSSYQTSAIGGISFIVKQSYADVIYRNIRTFTGFLARHKLYRKSLVSNADYSIISDEPLFVNELLRDNLTQNKFYELLGKFYNDEHISRYWFTSSRYVGMSHSPSNFIDSCHLTATTYSIWDGNEYAIVKNDSVSSNRNAIYIPYDSTQFDATSGSAYDSNFLELKSGVQYILQVDTSIEKESTTTDASLKFYLTSSVSEAALHSNYNNKHGILLGTIIADKVGILNNFDKQYFFFTPKNDLYGTMVIVPYKCKPYLKNISFRVYGDDGFSPDVFTTRVPWSISVANETFAIKSELFDINHNLVYSDLNILQNFDPSGSSLIPYIPGSTAGSTNIVGDLTVTGTIIDTAGSIIIGVGQLYVPGMIQRPTNEISSSRFVTKLGLSSNSGRLATTQIADIRHDDKYIYLATGSFSIDPSGISNPIGTKQSLATVYNRHIYFTLDGNNLPTIKHDDP